MDTKKISGIKIAKKIKENLREKVGNCNRPVSMDIVYVGHDPVIEAFIGYKKEFGESIGVDFRIHYFGGDTTQTKLEEEIIKIVDAGLGCVIQLPLPGHIDVYKILNLIPCSKDIDVLGDKSLQLFEKGENTMFPPVAGAVREALLGAGVSLAEKNIVIVGGGKLVGQPIAMWLEREGVGYDIVDMKTEKEERKKLLQGADIIISGVGVPESIKVDEIKDGVVLIDAGTSEVSKKLVGDISSDCYNKASYYTPVPGGIGPITIAILFRNLIDNLCNN